MIGKDDSAWTSLFYSVAASALLFTIAIPFVWVTPTADQWLLLAGISGFGIIVKDATFGSWVQDHVDSWWGAVARAATWMHTNDFVTGQVLTFVAIFAAMTSYVLVSLLGPREDFDLDRLLHRGCYVIDEDMVEAVHTAIAARRPLLRAPPLLRVRPLLDARRRSCGDSRLPCSTGMPLIVAYLA